MDVCRSPEARLAKIIEEQIASRNLGWNIYFSKYLVEASLVHDPGHRQRQNVLTQVTLGQGFDVLPASKREVGNHRLICAKSQNLTTDSADHTYLHGSRKFNEDRP